MLDRNLLIDNLRGFAMLVMILTHTTAFFPTDGVASFLWNWSHFAVPIFLFCSAYLFLQKGLDKPPHLWSYLKKRFTRLLIPYYLFLVVFLLCLFIISPKIVTAKYIMQSIFLTGGVDINWLVLLFLFLTVLLPLFAWSFLRARLFFWFFFIVSLGSTYFLLFQNVHISYKLIMWLPWSVILYFTLFYLKHAGKKKILGLLFLTCLTVFLWSYVVQGALSHSLVLIHNKYPPNIYYLSYGMTVLLGLIFLEKYIFRHKLFLRLIHFLSKYSYAIYFLHYLILTILATLIKEWHLNWITLFLAVLILTILLQKVYISAKLKVSL